MRILAIRGKNLASLAEPFEILLNSGPLEQAGLFAITGQTGAGKSTILDALCLALYDKIPRLPDGHGFAVGHKDEDENLRVVSTDVRSILRRGTSNAYAEVDFIGKDKHHYRARWEVSKARGKADGRLQAQEVTLSKIDDGQRIGQGKKNTLETISELIDLNFDQFRRSVLLAQGDFAAFLKAKKDERSSLLERITGTELYSELSIAAFDRARQEKDALNLITSRMQDQIPLDEEARQLLEQQRDQFIAQLADLDQQIASNQKIIDWYAELKKLQEAEQVARDELTISQQAWDAAEAGRQLMQKVEAAQPLRPLLAQYQTANAEHLDAQQKLKDSVDQQAAADIKLQTAKEQLSILAGTLAEAEQQQQQAQPVLIKARALDTRIDVIRKAVGTLSVEENQLLQALDGARKEHQALLNRQAEQTSALQQLNLWLEQNQAIKPISAEWSRWDAELERYQTLNVRKTDDALKAEQLRLAVTKDEHSLAELKLAIDDSHKKLELHQQALAQLKTQDSKQSLEDLHRSKDALEIKREQITRALNLANDAQELQQAIKQDTDQLAATEQAINESTLQLQTLNQQQMANGIALTEAKKALELIQATTHKNAEQFRSLLQEDQPCPVCGALEHPWKDQAGIGNEHAAAQSARVAELENLNETLIKAIVELTKSISQGQEQKTALAEKLAEAQTKLAQCGNDWAVLAMHNKVASVPDRLRHFHPPWQSPDFSITDIQLLPALKIQNEQINSALELIKQQEKAALELQRQLKAAQDLFDADQRNKEKLSAEYATVDKQHAKNKADLEHVTISIQEQEKQLQAIVDLLATPFRQLEDWQSRLQDSTAAFRQDCTVKAQQFQRTEQQIETAAKALEKINHDEKLAEQALKQCQQQHRIKQAELKTQTEEQQKLSVERDAVLPRLTADSYEQTVNQSLQAARAAHQQAGHTVSQAETELATHKQNQQHWQTETGRRYDNLEKALSALNQSLEKQAIDLEQLSRLLEKDEHWLAAQKAQMAALERGLQESAALLKVKADDCLKQQSHSVEIPEEDAHKLSAELQQQRQAIHTQKEEQVILLREDDKKIEAGRALKSELDSQQDRWDQWESLNELIGSKSGAKFRTFAQSLTLEALLAHSNQHLEDFAKRYALQRVPGSDLELQIIDRDMADDVRSVHSLSGGESFLVSLALALGLASLSSNKTQVESLFIDEGFGSLDPETLDIAIASLDTLQALGRKVGVISHVPILVERIGAKVVVEKQGGGRSSVLIVGGY
ncbi:SbcC/MukB-like Walker B domain-containing protein [Methylobacter tundripaludum]|uniref:SbcC/MukB-like Walker B domain-containing protein n=1 Tax=Methylobacter tundripaludum TaxID=173365 RepID=UPI0004DF359D|nr:AAA family ATPase [Methylobacter tundripaludum]